MPIYKHYSFDLWLTLIRSNPAFKQERARYFHQHFNFNNQPLVEVERVFRQVDLMINHINENTGKNVDADEMYLMVISLLNGGHECIAGIDAQALCSQMDRLIFSYMPKVYSTDTINSLAHLRDAGATTNILSNTGFIRGKTLRLILQELGLAEYFNFQLYSDEEGYSKPHPAFFAQMLDKAASLHKGNLQPDEIIHVGDNAHTDGDGATACGIKSFIINSNSKTIQNLLHEPYHVFTS
jgi:putative hydrolase of the HAD superfamily